MKLWEGVVEARLRSLVPSDNEQFGFTPWKGTTDTIFCAKNAG